jgi:hypothetical protein
MEGEKSKKYKRIVDNKMPYYGETDDEKRTIKVNKKKSKDKPSHIKPVNKHASKYPEVLDTITHEEMHAKHPKMHEKTVRIETRNLMKKMSENKKRKMYSLYK